MSDTPQKETLEGTLNAVSQMPVHFVKSNFFRVVHANGVWYGGDNQGNLHLTFFNERNPIPKMLVINLGSGGTVIGEDESKRLSKNGFVREMEIDVVLSLQVAQELYQTLGENLRAIEESKKLALSEKVKVFGETIIKR